MLKIDESFYVEEVRDEFLVTLERKHIWAVQLDLLNHFINVCQQHDIKCFVIWGTLLGAARHKGFIPWDDDVDVALLREDYEKLKTLSPGTFSYPYFLQNAYTDKKYFMSYSRLRRSDTTGIVVGSESKEYNNGIFIDIYPLDAIPESKCRRFKKRFFTNLYAGIARAKLLKNGASISLKQRILKILSFSCSYVLCCKKHEAWCSRYNDKYDEIGLFYHSSLVKKYHFNRKCAKDITFVPFEMLMVPVPKEYREVLNTVYGDYMKFPPVLERGKWHDGQIIYNPFIPYKEYIEKK